MVGITVSIELFLLQNVAANLPILWAAVRVSGRRARLWRLLLAALVGAIYGVVAYLPAFTSAQSLVGRLAISCIMALVAAGRGPVSIQARTALFVWLSTFLFGGAGTSAMQWLGSRGYPLPPVLLCAVLLLAAGAVALGIRHHDAGISGGLCDLELSICGQTLFVKALIDNGNRLREPISGLPVIVLSKSAATGIAETAVSAEGAVAAGLRMVPYAGVGASGVLPAVLCERISIRRGGKVKALGAHYVAISEGPICSEGTWDALVPGN